MRGLLIREAKKDEVHLLKEQRFAAYQPCQKELSPKQWERLESNLAIANNPPPGMEVFVAEIGWEIVGSIALLSSGSIKQQLGDYPEIRLLAVTPEFRSRGIGKALVEHCIDISKIRKQQSIKLYTECFMKNAIDLYEKMGFTRIASLDFKPLDNDFTINTFHLDI